MQQQLAALKKENPFSFLKSHQSALIAHAICGERMFSIGHDWIKLGAWSVSASRDLMGPLYSEHATAIPL